MHTNHPFFIWFAQGARCGHVEGKPRVGVYVHGEEELLSSEAADVNVEKGYENIACSPWLACTRRRVWAWGVTTMQTSRNRTGPAMSRVLLFVANNPGLAMVRAAKYAGPNGSLRYGYRSAHRCLAAGLIRSVPGPHGARLLYPAESR